LSIRRNSNNSTLFFFLSLTFFFFEQELLSFPFPPPSIFSFTVFLRRVPEFFSFFNPFFFLPSGGRMTPLVSFPSPAFFGRDFVFLEGEVEAFFPPFWYSFFSFPLLFPRGQTALLYARNPFCFPACLCRCEDLFFLPPPPQFYFYELSQSLVLPSPLRSQGSPPLIIDPLPTSPPGLFYTLSAVPPFPFSARVPSFLSAASDGLFPPFSFVVFPLFVLSLLFPHADPPALFALTSFFFVMGMAPFFSPFL